MRLGVLGYREFLISISGVVLRVVDVNHKALVPAYLLEGISIAELAVVLPDCGILNLWEKARRAMTTCRRQAVYLVHPWSRQLFFGYALPAGKGLVVVRLYAIRNI